MPANEYSDSDLYNKDHLEKVFWIEIAKRKAFRSAGTGFARLDALAQGINEFCTAEGGTDVSMDAGDWQVLKAFENGGLFNPLWYHEEEEPILFKAMDKYHSEAVEVSELLKPYLHGFCLADFATRADIGLLHRWWDYISSDKGKEELGTRDSHYGSFGEPRIVDSADEEQPFSRPTRRFSSYPCPVSSPKIICHPQAWALATDEYDITVNGTPLEDQLVLLVDLSKPLPPIALIQAKLEIAQAAASGRYTLDALRSGRLPDGKFDSIVTSGSSGLVAHLKAQAERHEIVRSKKNVSPMIYGLYAWDLIEGFRLDDEMNAARSEAIKAARKISSHKGGDSAKGSQLTDVDACRITLKTLGREMSEQEFEDGVRNIRHALTKIVRPKIENYEPAKLPWMNS